MQQRRKAAGSSCCPCRVLAANEAPAFAVGVTPPTASPVPVRTPVGFRVSSSETGCGHSVYLHFTRRGEQQLDDTAFPQIRAARAPDPRPYASTHRRYRVVDR